MFLDINENLVLRLQIWWFWSVFENRRITCHLGSDNSLDGKSEQDFFFLEWDLCFWWQRGSYLPVFFLQFCQSSLGLSVAKTSRFGRCNFADSDAPSRLRDIISAQGTVWSRKDTVSGWPCNQAGCLRQTAVWNTKALSLSLSLSLSSLHTHTHTHTHKVMTDSPRAPSSVPPAAMPVIRRPTPRSGAVTVEHDKQLSALKHQSVDLTAAWFGD